MNKKWLWLVLIVPVIVPKIDSYIEFKDEMDRRMQGIIDSLVKKFKSES